MSLGSQSTVAPTGCDTPLLLLSPSPHPFLEELVTSQAEHPGGQQVGGPHARHRGDRSRTDGRKAILTAQKTEGSWET